MSAKMQIQMPTPPTNISELIEEVKKESVGLSAPEVSNVLIATIRKYKFWPALQVKKFFKNKNLVLLHNTYKRIDVSHFQTLYDQCRSVVLDMAATENHVVVSYTDQVPERVSVGSYKVTKNEQDVCDEAFEGTVVTVYFYQDKWYFGTSACPLVDSSRYFHPTKTHGIMLDEAIADIMGVPPPSEENEFNFGVTTSDDLRKAFTHYLDSSRAYAFILVHHENKHVVDYTERFGEKYAKLVHIVMRDRVTLQDIPVTVDTVSDNLREKFVYPKTYDSPTEAIEELVQASTTNEVAKAYGFIVKTHDGRRVKVSSEEISVREEFDLGNPNMWINMLHVYIQNKPHYKIVDYQRDYCPDLIVPNNNRGQPLAPTYIIHTVICSMRDVVFASYTRSTTFNSHTKRFYINRKVDAELSPIMRFHMSQLRNIQVTTHDHSMISPHAIYHYLCHHQPMKNLRLLIKYFATTWITMNPSVFPPRTTECFFHLDTLLSQASN
jgi:hypothetical protein